MATDTLDIVDIYSTNFAAFVKVAREAHLDFMATRNTGNCFDWRLDAGADGFITSEPPISV